MQSLACPVCAASLAAAPCADPAATCLECVSGHRFFTCSLSPTSDASATAGAAQLASVAGLPPSEVARFWLSDRRARSVLNEQLAELLRTFLEGRYATSEEPPAFCPICSGRLSEYQQPDVWVQGLRCPSHHTWAVRGGRLAGGSPSRVIELKSELNRATAAALVRGWLRANPLLEPQLHASVRGVLEQWHGGV